MQDLASLSKEQLLEFVGKQAEQLATQSDKVARDVDIIKQLESKVEQLEKDYLKLWQERFAAKSERYIADPDQLRIDFGDTDEAADAAEGLAASLEEADLIPEHTRRRRKKRDESLPAHLDRKEILVDVDDADKHCATHGEKAQLPQSMWDVREKLVYVPPSLLVEVRKYPKYACQDQPQCGIASAERPTGLVEGDKYDTSVATEILVNKYAYHLPIYRQQDMFAGSGWTPSRSTMLNILTNCYFVIEPLLAYFKQVVLTDSIVACDDTGVTLNAVKHFSNAGKRPVLPG